MSAIKQNVKCQGWRAECSILKTTVATAVVIIVFGCSILETTVATAVVIIVFGCSILKTTVATAVVIVVFGFSQGMSRPNFFPSWAKNSVSYDIIVTQQAQTGSVERGSTTRAWCCLLLIL